MGASLKNVLIGIFVLAACGIIIFILLFLHPRIGDEAKTLKVRFTDIDKVNIGTRVTYAGKPVGEVVDIQEIPDARSKRVARNGDIYVYELTLKIDSGVDVFNTDEISVRTSGLLGERNIAIDPQPLHPDEKLYVIENEAIYAEQVGGVEETLKQFTSLTKKLESFLDKLNETMDQIKEEKIVDNLGQMAQNVADITGSLNQPDKWRGTLDNIWTLSERMNRSWDRVDPILAKVDQTIDKFHTAGINTDEFTHKIKDIIDTTGRGEGTMGRLFVSDDLYLQLKSILSKGGTVVDDMNNYGLLFQSNKQWQRVNARRLNLVNRLASPQYFSSYFNSEINSISNSLSRVCSAIDESEAYPEGLYHQPGFNQKLADLLRRTKKIEEELRMYNQQVVDQAE